MKIGITGHSRGIGRALFDVYSPDNQVFGFSRSNGYDISIEETRLEILKICTDFDIFVNNAWDYYGQNDLLKKFIEKWEGSKEKTIINISSKAAFVGNEVNHPYANSKKELNQTIRTRLFEPYPRILNIIPGVVDTEMGEVAPVPKKLTTEDTAKFVVHMSKLVSPVCVQEIMFADPSEFISMPHIIEYANNPDNHK